MLALFALLFCAASSAQDDWGIWQYTTVSKNISPKCGALLRLELRMKNEAQDLDCALVMPGIWYSPSPWLRFGFIYDFAVAQKANRHVLLPYVQGSWKWGGWGFSAREMGQYIIKPENLLFRTKLQLSYRIPDTVLSPFVAVEPYTSVAPFKVMRASNFAGVAFSLGSNAQFELAYNYYYLATPPSRHLLSLGYTYRL